LQWLRDGLGIIKASSEVEALAAAGDRPRGRLRRPRLRRPWRAALGSIRPRVDRWRHPWHDRAHIARAALEGIAFQVADVLRAMEADAKIKLKELRVDAARRRTIC